MKPTYFTSGQWKHGKKPPSVKILWWGTSGHWHIKGWRFHWFDTPINGYTERVGWVELGPISIRYTSGHYALQENA